MALRRAGWKDDRGQGLVEYAVIIGLVAMGLVVALSLLRGTLGNIFGRANQAIEATGQSSAGGGGTESGVGGGASVGPGGGGSGGSSDGPGGGGGPSGGPGCGNGAGGGQGSGCQTGQQ